MCFYTKILLLSIILTTFCQNSSCNHPNLRHFRVQPQTTSAGGVDVPSRASHQGPDARYGCQIMQKSSAITKISVTLLSVIVAVF